MNTLRIGVIGLGWFGEIHCDAIVGVPNLQLAALCTRRPERLKALAQKYGVKKAYRDYHDLLADPSIDAVSIVTMWDQHTGPAVDALTAGKHVFLEKPMASTVDDCRKIISAADGAPEFCRSATYAGSTQGTGWRSRPSKQERSGVLSR